MIKRFFVLLITTLLIVGNDAGAAQKRFIVEESGEFLLGKSLKGAPKSLGLFSREAIFSSSASYHGSVPKQFFGEDSEIKAGQVFSRPTYDRIAKYILCEDEAVRVDILKAFTGIRSLSSATQLDEHYNPFDPLHNLRKLINSTSSQHVFEMISDSSTVELVLDGKKNKQASEVLQGYGKLYKDLMYAFPNYKHRSTVDFLCETDFGYVTIEFQVAKQDHWDKRALAYIASIYGNQLKPRQDYPQIQDVIGINILGDGSTPYWRDGRFIRDYMFVDQKGSGHRIPSLRLIQYSLGDATLDHKELKENDSLKEWIEFFKSAHEKQSLPESITEPVKKAYDMIRVDVLKKERPELLKTLEDYFASLTEHDKAVEAKAIDSIAKKLLKSNIPLEEIMEITGMSEDQIRKLKSH